MPTDSRGPAIGSALFLLAAPGTVAGLIPWSITRWRFDPPLLGFEPLRWLGGALIAAGLAVLLESFARFARHGGTPAPIAPTESLVVTGLYRHVRNPMYCAVVSLIAGQALLFGSAELLGYAALIWTIFHLFVIFYEEPRLTADHGELYAEYRAHVPRWAPRVRPWKKVGVYP